MPFNLTERALCELALCELALRVLVVRHQSVDAKRAATRRCLIWERMIMRATIENLGRPARWQAGDKSDDIIDIVTFGQRGRKPRHLRSVEIVGMGTPSTSEVALVGRLQVPIIEACECWRTESVVALTIAAMAGTANIDVVVLTAGGVAGDCGGGLGRG